MEGIRKTAIFWSAVSLLAWLISPWYLIAQQKSAPAGTESATTQNDPVADLSPENRALFDAIRKAAQQGNDAEVLANCKKLLPALKPDTKLADFVTQIAAGAALETGDASYALALIKPFVDAHPKDWHAAATLVRLYAESGERTLRDQQIAHLLALHKETSDPNFTKLHIFPIQKVKLHSGNAVFLYPFAPFGRDNIYLVALVNSAEGKEEYRIELESENADQAFFKARHPGERRFSIDTFRESKNGESQALHGFVDGVFDYDTMRDRMLGVANGEDSSHK